MHIVLGYDCFFWQHIFYGCGDGLQHTSRGCDAYLFQGHVQLFFQRCLHSIDGTRHPANVMDLAVQHGTRLMLPHKLCKHIERILFLIAYRPHHVAGTDIQAKYQRHVIANLLATARFALILDYLRHLVKSFLPGAVIVDHHLAAPAVHALRNLSRKNLLDFLPRIAPRPHQAFAPQLFRGIDIPQLITDFIILILN